MYTRKVAWKTAVFALSLFSLAKQKLRSEINAICEQNKGQQQMLLRKDDMRKQEQMDMK